jgi:hypothetical protein
MSQDALMNSSGRADDPAAILVPLFDAFWQAGGWPQSPSYGEDGAWQRRDD